MEMCKNGIRYDVYPTCATVKGFSTKFKNASILKVPSSVYGKDVISIEDRAFKDAQIVEAELPRTLQHIGIQAFANCTKLKTVSFGKRGIQAYNLTIAEYCFVNCINLEYVGSNAFLQVGECAFWGCGKLELLGKCEQLSRRALVGCQQLVDVQILLGGSVEKNTFDNQDVSVLLCGGPPQQSDYSTLLPNLKAQNVEIRCFSSSPLANLIYDGYRIRIVD